MHTNDQKSPQQQKLGILGGGQLGRMLIQSAMDLNLDVHIIDPDIQAPCRHLATTFTEGSLTDFDSIYAFGRSCDLLSIEIENVNTEALLKLEQEGKKVYPQPEIIALIKDKRKQKEFYRREQIPTAPFTLTDNREAVKKLNRFPVVNKLATEGYDGRGVQILRSQDDLSKAFDAPSLVEDLIDFSKEIAVIVARNENGEVKTFPAVEMVFHPEANLVEYLFAPAEIPSGVAEKADHIARTVIDKLQMVGLLAVEMFVTRENEILVNEVAPRPHNSGHHTIEANVTSQYEQHLRAIFNWPLGDTRLKGQAAMVNVLGAEGHKGEAAYVGLDEVLKISGAHVHLYGKKQTKPFRKMGHVTIEDDDMDSLKDKVNRVKNTLKVIAL